MAAGLGCIEAKREHCHFHCGARTLLVAFLVQKRGASREPLSGTGDRSRRPVSGGATITLSWIIRWVEQVQRAAAQSLASDTGPASAEALESVALQDRASGCSTLSREVWESPGDRWFDWSNRPARSLSRHGIRPRSSRRVRSVTPNLQFVPPHHERHQDLTHSSHTRPTMDQGSAHHIAGK